VISLSQIFQSVGIDLWTLLYGFGCRNWAASNTEDFPKQEEKNKGRKKKTSSEKN
jgi:hypothetical protein